MNLYTFSGSSWLVKTADGKTMTFGKSSISRIADPSIQSNIYAWMLEEEQDMFGHIIRYEYIQNGGQPYLSSILYGYEAGGTNPLYEIRFEYIDKFASLTSYRTQFEVSTKKLLSGITLSVSGVVARGYRFTYDSPDTPISHLTSIGEYTGSKNLPVISFSY